MLPTKFQLICPMVFREDFFRLANHKQELPMAAMEILYRLSGFRGEDFLVIDKPETIMAYCGHVCKQIGTKWAILIDASCKMLLYLAKWFQREDILENWPTRTKNCLWQPSLITDRNEMNNLNRGLSIDASDQGSVHLAKRLQRRIFFRNWPTRNKNCLWRPCLLTDWNHKSNLYRAHSIDASYQVSVRLAKRFQRRLKCEKLTSYGKSSHCLWQEELTIYEILVYLNGRKIKPEALKT